MNGDRTSLLESARLRIAHIRVEDLDDVKRALLNAARVSATTLAVGRVGIWSLDEEQTTLRRVVLYDQRAPSEAEQDARDDVALPLGRWPAYLAAVLSRRVVVAEDARNDPSTRELAEPYLVPRGVTSMLDAPLFVNGEVWGIVCHEHSGDLRAWSSREIDFAGSVADMVSALLEQATRLVLEERLRRAEAELEAIRRSEACVRTAAAIGHDINTIVQSIVGSAERGLREEAPEDRQGAFRAVMNDCQRIARVVDQLRELERPTPSHGVETDLSFVLEDTRPTILSLLGPSHALVTELSPTAFVPSRRADAERIVLNLVVNAKEAMPDGGTVRVVVRSSPSTVVLEVRDEGHGCAPEQAARVFEPYFTTKNGRNAGLGLFAVEALARSAGGVVAFTSEPGVGTTVTVTWPRGR